MATVELWLDAEMGKSQAPSIRVDAMSTGDGVVARELDDGTTVIEGTIRDEMGREGGFRVVIRPGVARHSLGGTDQ